MRRGIYPSICVLDRHRGNVLYQEKRKRIGRGHFRIPLSLPSISQIELNRAVKILESGQYVNGEEGRHFGAEFAAYCDAKDGIPVSSGTAALHLALLAAGVGPGDEVITVAHTFTATIEAILQTGAKPVLVDIDPMTYTLNPQFVRNASTRKTKAILPVHLYGHPADMKPIVEQAERLGVPIIEDAAQAHGALYDGKKTGGIGTLACFSFYPSKNMHVGGEGGIVTTTDSALGEKVWRLRDHGRKDKYVHDLIGFNYRMGEVQSAIGRVQLKKLDAMNQKRREIAYHYNSLLENSGKISLPIEQAWARHVYHLYVVRCQNPNQMAENLARKGIETGAHYRRPCHRQPALRNKVSVRDKLVETELASRQVLSLPIYPGLSKTAIEEVVSCLLEFRS